MTWALSWDLSPLRPDAFMAMDAYLWTEAVQLRDAYQAGINDAKGEAAMGDQLKKRASAMAC